MDPLTKLFAQARHAADGGDPTNFVLAIYDATRASDPAGAAVMRAIAKAVLDAAQSIRAAQVLATLQAAPGGAVPYVHLNPRPE